MPVPSGWAIDALIAEVFDAGWWLTPVLGDTRVVVRDGWRQRITPSLPQGGDNEISHCLVDAAAIEQVLDETIAEYRRLRVQFRFVVGPGSKPDDLAERLERRGFSRVDVQGMVRDVSPVGGVPDDVRVEAARDARAADEFTEVMACGWAMDPAPMRPLNRARLGK